MWCGGGPRSAARARMRGERGLRVEGEQERGARRGERRTRLGRLRATSPFTHPARATLTIHPSPCRLERLPGPPRMHEYALPVDVPNSQWPERIVRATLAYYERQSELSEWWRRWSPQERRRRWSPVTSHLTRAKRGGAGGACGPRCVTPPPSSPQLIALESSVKGFLSILAKQFPRPDLYVWGEGGGRGCSR